MDAAAELGRNPASEHQIQPEYENEQTEAGRDCRTCLARPIFRRERGQRNIPFPCSADHVQNWQPYPVDQYSCYICVTIQYTVLPFWYVLGWTAKDQRNIYKAPKRAHKQKQGKNDAKKRTKTVQTNKNTRNHKMKRID